MAQTSQRALLDALRTFEHGKVVSAREAVALIRTGDTLATGGFVGIGFAENIAVALEQRFLETTGEDGTGATSRWSTRPARATARPAASTTSRTKASCGA